MSILFKIAEQAGKSFGRRLLEHAVEVGIITAVTTGATILVSRALSKRDEEQEMRDLQDMVEEALANAIEKVESGWDEEDEEEVEEDEEEAEEASESVVEPVPVAAAPARRSSRRMPAKKVDSEPAESQKMDVKKRKGMQRLSFK